MKAPQRLTATRQADSAKRRLKVSEALQHLTATGDVVTVSSVARVAGVHRSFLYRHTDLHASILAASATDPEPATGVVSRRSIHADLANMTERNTRLLQQIAYLETRLSEALGEQIWRRSGIGAPPDVTTLHERITTLEQQNLDLKRQLDERDDELEAARAANRELMTTANRISRHARQ